MADDDKIICSMTIRALTGEEFDEMFRIDVDDDKAVGNSGDGISDYDKQFWGTGV